MTSEVEFVNREFAESEAKRFVALQNSSDEAKVESWFALQAVADQVGPRSNVGVLGVSWSANDRLRGGGYYSLKLRCVDGVASSKTGGPATLELARSEEYLAPVRETLGRLVASKGGPLKANRPRGMTDALIVAISTSPEGRAWLDEMSERAARQTLAMAVRVADVYGRDGINPRAGVQAHQAFMRFDDRNELIRRFPLQEQANAKRMSLLRGGGIDVPPHRTPRASQSQVIRLAARAGVSTREARTILHAVMDGRSKTKLIRAVNEACKMVEADPNSKRLREAA